MILVPSLVLNMLCSIFLCRTDRLSFEIANTKTKVGLFPVSFVTLPKPGIGKQRLNAFGLPYPHHHHRPHNKVH